MKEEKLKIELVGVDIIDVVEKWFYMKIYTDDRQAILQNSCIFGNDALNIFLKSLNWLERQQFGIKYLRWEGESNSYIWILEKKEDVLIIEIWLGGNKLNLFYDSSEALREKKELLFSAVTSYYYFIQNVKKSFETYLFFYEKKDNEYNISLDMLNKLKGY